MTTTTTTTTHRARRYRKHELMFDSTDAGHTASCSCSWGRQARPFLDVDDAHYAGAEHLAAMAYRRLALQGVVATKAPSGAGMWAELRTHHDRIGDEAQAVLDIAHKAWPERTGYRGGVGDGRG